jgi:hypothetical protein
MENVGERVHQAGLADARNPFQQDVPAGEETRDREVHDFFVPDDAASDFLGDADETLAKLFDGWTDGGSSGHCLRMK